MLLNTVEKEALSPYMRKIADDLYPRVDPLFMPHFERYMGLLGNAPEHAERFALRRLAPILRRQPRRRAPQRVAVVFEQRVSPR